ncbi:putative phage abortive infection protein [Oceanimonas sp. CHS3-5]|uniref:putative phage abortive infection protein n=1 Tax=Oceanimonas sp. CHS3-5 TaxID=3068186 RepID=UPI00273EF57E|nr:putative phage abortive infection protein [Oceanimonas sp. CHS3-5]MDP5291865.1 putative phage abortive infection protein [Oceanimonas sp. CHS3-5]
MKEWIKSRFLKVNAFLDKRYPKFEALFTDAKTDQVGSSLNKVLFKIISSAVIVAGFLLVINLLLITFTDRGGVFGDFLGGVLNPILTFFTLFGLIVTIIIQRQELRLARNEYEKTADALSTSAIETTFFNIIDLHHNIVDNLKVDLEELSDKAEAQKVIKGISSSILKAQIGASFASKSLKAQGRPVFEEILNYLSIEAKSPEESLERYKYIQNNHNHILGHYFRNLYQALKVIHNYDEEKLQPEEKRKYTSILRAQLSTKELALLFMNCIEGVADSGQFKNLLIEFQMLEHLPISEINGGYSLAGSKTPLASDEMFLQYKHKKDLGLDLQKYYGGAFGQNRGVPYSLRPNKSIQQTAEAAAD